MSPLPSPPAPAHATASARVRAGAAVAVVCFWLAWSIPALVAVNRPAPPLWDEHDILRQVEQAVTLPMGKDVLLTDTTPECACETDSLDRLVVDAAEAGLTVIPAAAGHLPYPVVVVNAQRQLVYAGSAVLSRNCLGRPPTAWPLIATLLQHGQRTPFYSAPCLC